MQPIYLAVIMGVVAFASDRIVFGSRPQLSAPAYAGLGFVGSLVAGWIVAGLIGPGLDAVSWVVVGLFIGAAAAPIVYRAFQ
jgi:hypothetical protein